jgi:thioesterase domain-containing protein
MFEHTSATEWSRLLQQLWSEQIPLASAMQVVVRRLDDRGLQLAAPLAPNRNHVGTAFGGSLQGLATLAGWGVTLVVAGDAGRIGVVIRASQMQFDAPVTGELLATAAWPAPAVVADLRAQLAARGRARLTVEVGIAGAGAQAAARFSGEFVARATPRG